MTEIVPPRLPGQQYVDALLGQGPHWNFLPNHDNTIRYTFAVTSPVGEVSGVQALTATQQANARTAFGYISALTGIRFIETADAGAAKVHLAGADILEEDVAGLCISSYSYTEGGEVNDYSGVSYVYLDNNEWFDYVGQLTPGSSGYELMLHELGHMLGLKHPFQTTEGNSTTLPDWQDHTRNTLMSYTSEGGPYAVFQQYDIATLMWLYGGDGLGGKLGVGGAGGYWMGSTDNNWLNGAATDDVLQGAGGDDVIDGGGGSDTVVYSGTRASYEITWSIYSREATVTDRAGKEGSDRVRAVELFQFSDGVFTLAQVTGADLVAPPAPAISVVAENDKVTVSGTAEPESLVEVFYARSGLPAVSMGLHSADASGAWSAHPWYLVNDSYVFFATALDQSGNTSPASAEYALVINAVLPPPPTLHIEQDASNLIGGNRPVMYGTAYPGSMVQVFVDQVVTITTTADAKGNWEAVGDPVFPGSRMAYVVATTPDGRTIYDGKESPIRIDPAAGFGGTAAGDTFIARDGNNAYSGGAGADTMVYAGARAGYTVAFGERGVTVSDTLGGGGTDTLFSVERLHFGDVHLAIDIAGNGGQAYRIYQAAFDRAPDPAGVGYWMARMDAGVALETVATGFMQSQEFVSMYGANPTNAAFVATLYQNVLDRAGDQGGIDFWVAALDEGRTSHASVLAHFSESPENVANLASVIGSGFAYSPYL